MDLLPALDPAHPDDWLLLVGNELDRISVWNNPQDVKGKRNAEPTQTTIEVTPIGGWTFDEDDAIV